MKPVWFDMKT